MMRAIDLARIPDAPADHDAALIRGWIQANGPGLQ